MSRRKDFGEFGKGKPALRRRSRTVTLLLYATVLGLLIALAPPLWEFASRLYRTLIEGEIPTVEFVALPPGLGSAATEVQILVKDLHSGLDQVTVQLEQSRTVKELDKRRYSRIQNEDTLRIPIDPRALGLREGEARIAVKVFDKSLWSNSVLRAVNLKVDFKPPTIEVLSTQHNILEGGVNIVFYRLPSDPNAFSGVVVNSTIFPGFPAITLDQGFANVPDVYFAFFAVPSDAARRGVVMHLVSRDEVGNSSTAKFPFQILPRSSKTLRVELSPADARRMVDATYEQYLEFLKLLGRDRDTEFFPAVRDEDVIDRFATVTTSFRAELEQASAELFSRPKSERFWHGPFGRPGGREWQARFGWTITWLMEGRVLGSTVSEELWYRSVANSEIVATNHGKVILADHFGPFGKTVILDHGFGLTTLYTHLSSFSCTEGDELRKGQIVGLSGSTGLIPFTGVGFQLRLHGVPIRPEEWWDEGWLKAHIDKKTEQVQRLLGIEVIKPLLPKE